jgi:hypothetical protein
MGFKEWLKDTFGGDEPKAAAPAATPNADFYRGQAAAPATPRAGTQNSPATWKSRGAPTTTGTKTPSAQTLDMLRQGGWSVPTVTTGPKPVAKSDVVEFESDPTALAKYSYNISDEEWDRLKKNYEGRLGYTAPKQPVNQSKASAAYNYQGPMGSAGAAVKEPEEKMPTFNMEETTAAPLSYESYAKLTPDQKAGVDLNALFVDAREKDLSDPAAPTTEQRASYEKEVEKLLGPGRGSEKYAPETVALLKQVDLDLPGLDLDQVLALDYTITADDLMKFELKGAPAKEIYGAGAAGDQARVYDLYRTEENVKLNLIEAVRKSRPAIEAAMQDVMGVRGDVVSTMAADRKADVSSFGGTAHVDTKVAGYPLAYPTGVVPNIDEEAAGKDALYTTAYGLLADKSKPMSELWNLIQNSPAAKDEAELDALFKYFDQRSQQELQYGRPKGLTGENVRSPKELREWIGLR